MATEVYDCGNEGGGEQMKTTARNCEKSEATTPPDGIYVGIWSGYEVTFYKAGGATYRAKTITGIRSTNTGCRVVVTDGQIEVEGPEVAY